MQKAKDAQNSYMLTLLEGDKHKNEYTTNSKL